MPASKNVLLQNDPGTTQEEAGFGFMGRFWFESTVDGIVAFAGGGRASATKLDAMFNRVSTVATAGDSVVLPAAFQGLSIAVLNDTAISMQVFAQGADTLNTTVAGTAGVPQMGKSLVWYTCHTDGNWVANGIGSGFSGANTTYSYQEALTAHAGGGQANALPITASTARFTTVATAGDSGVLMTAAPGLIISVINAGAAILNVFPATGDQINALGANNAFAVPPGGVADFFCTAAGVWHTLLSTTGGANQAYNAAANTAGFTLTGAQISGGLFETTLDLTGTLAGAANVQLPTVAQLVAALTVAGMNPSAGMTYELDLIQRSAVAAWTVTTNTGWTLTGTMALGNATMRKFYVTLTSLTAAVLRSVSSGTVGAA